MFLVWSFRTYFYSYNNVLWYYSEGKKNNFIYNDCVEYSVNSSYSSMRIQSRDDLFYSSTFKNIFITIEVEFQNNTPYVTFK